MVARSPADVLAASRRQTSFRKRQNVLTVVQQMLNDGDHITFAAVARAAKVSNWLVYAEGVREHITAAMEKQDQPPPPAQAAGGQASTASLRIDLAMAREEIKALRKECDRLQTSMRQNLGHQLDQITQRPLTHRISELTDANRKLEQKVAELLPLEAQVHTLEADLAAAGPASGR
ncbi:DUF6262 family protein [Streptomyces sp. NPDC001820]|uniref:DUF6262 family protein n=1 Tax=Streptomyces sp. NPDC001820 TaxID=3364613 RepID=UPI0036A6FF8F